MSVEADRNFIQTASGTSLNVVARKSKLTGNPAFDKGLEMVHMIKSSVSRSEIQAVLLQRWGTISDLSQLAEGLDSQAFGFRQGATEYVVRINQSVTGFEKDLLVSRRFASPSLPVPAVLDIGRLDDQHVFCVSRRAPGVRLQDVEATYLPELVGPTVQTMAAIAAVDLKETSGFGRFDASGTGPNASWQDFLTSITSADRFDWRAASRSVDMKTVVKLFHVVETLAKHCPDERRLIHGDFGTYNVLTDGRSITAVIDWDLALFGDPLYDVANLFFWREARMRQQIQYFERQSSSVPHWDERILCYQLRIGLQEIYESAIGVGPIASEWLTKRCTDILDQAPAR